MFLLVVSAVSKVHWLVHPMHTRVIDINTFLSEVLLNQTLLFLFLYNLPHPLIFTVSQIHPVFFPFTILCLYFLTNHSLYSNPSIFYSKTFQVAPVISLPLIYCRFLALIFLTLLIIWHCWPTPLWHFPPKTFTKWYIDCFTVSTVTTLFLIFLPLTLLGRSVPSYFNLGPLTYIYMASHSNLTSSFLISFIVSV